MKQESFLTQHLRDADENYFEHLAFTIRVSATLLVVALIALIHGLMPFIFTHTSSKLLAKITAEMQARKAACEARKALKSQATE